MSEKCLRNLSRKKFFDYPSWSISVTPHFYAQHRTMLLLYFFYCNLNPRFAALVNLGDEKCIPIFLPGVHFWNKNFLSRWEREESWVRTFKLSSTLVQSGPGLCLGLGSCSLPLARLHQAWCSLLASSFSKHWNCEIRNKHYFLFAGSVFSPCICFSAVWLLSAHDGHCGVSRSSEPCFTSRHHLQLTVKPETREHRLNTAT